MSLPVQITDELKPITSHGFQHFIDGFVDLSAGTAGGIACVYVGQPLDTVKVKMQTFPDLYHNSVKCAVETFQKDGIRRGLYAGTVPALAANIGENAVLFAAYGFCQKFIGWIAGQPDVMHLSPLQNAFSGSLAAIFSTFTLCPTELIKCKLQAMREMESRAPSTATTTNKAQVKPRIGPWGLTRKIVREEGIRGMFRGFWPTFAREVPGYFFFFGGYETSRALMTPKGMQKDQIGPVKTCICGGIGGVSLWTAIFPADVVKSRVQVSGEGSLFRTFTHILRNEGIRALYKGLGPTVVRSFFATGALFVAFEFTKKHLHDLLG